MNFVAETEAGRLLSRSRKVLFVATAVFGGLLIGAFVAEMALRIAGYAYPRTSQRDDFTGTLRIPGVEFVYRDEGFSHVRINSAGFRDDDWERAKPPGVVRVAVLGDSYVEGFQVEKHERLTELLERELNGAQGLPGTPQVEVLNFGMGGYGTAQELMCLRHHVWSYSPDVVVLTILTGNDIRNNSRTLENDDGRPYFHFVDGALRLDESFRNTPAHNRGVVERLALWMVDRSRMFQVLWQVRRVTAQSRRRALAREAAEQPGAEVGLTSWIYQEPSDPDHREAWKVTEALLVQMRDEVEARGAKFFAVTLSNGIQVHPDAGMRQQFAASIGVADLLYPDRRLREIGNRFGIPMLSLAPEFQQLAQQTGVFLHGFPPKPGLGHWNANGHREAAARIAKDLRRLFTTSAPVPSP
jgi:hypothetical protein